MGFRKILGVLYGGVVAMISAQRTSPRGPARRSKTNIGAKPAIGNVILQGTRACIYDERGTQLATIPMAKGSEILGFTSTTANIHSGSMVYTYDARGTLRCARQLGESGNESLTPSRIVG